MIELMILSYGSASMLLTIAGSIVLYSRHTRHATRDELIACGIIRTIKEKQHATPVA